MEKGDPKKQELKRRLAERARRHSQALKRAHCNAVINSAYEHRPKTYLSADVVDLLSTNPRVRYLIVEPNVYGLVATEEVCEGAYIAEYVHLWHEWSACQIGQLWVIGKNDRVLADPLFLPSWVFASVAEVDDCVKNYTTNPLLHDFLTESTRILIVLRTAVRKAVHIRRVRGQISKKITLHCFESLCIRPVDKFEGLSINVTISDCSVT